MKTSLSSLALTPLLALSALARAEIKTQIVEYRDGKTVLEGYLAYDDANTNPRPGVMLVHAWMGLGDEVQRRARELAGQGYVAFAADIYGKGVRPQSPAEAGKLAGEYKGDRALLRRRAAAGLKTLKAQKFVIKNKTAAIGFCFGGTTVLELARSGADVRGVVSFHGGLGTPNLADAKKIKAKVLVLHGAIDPNVPPEEVAKFYQEMNEAKVDYQFVAYSGAVHAFTEPAAGNDISKGAAYNEVADRRSFAAMGAFFKEIL